MKKISLSTVLFGALFLINQPLTASELTCRGDREECPDLLGVPIEVRRWFDRNSVHAQCGALVVACAKLYGADRKMTKCVVHMHKEARKNVLLHEINHCRGWTHTRRNYADNWRPYNYYE